jgi:iron complex outermembrane receptor protein
MPSDTFEAEAGVTLASNERTEIDAMLNIPLGAQAGVRLVGWSVDQSQGDYFNPVSGQYLDAFDDLGGRIVFTADPTDAVSISLVVETTGGQLPGTTLFFPTAGETKSTVARDTHPSNEFDTTRVSGQISYNTDAGVFTLVAGTRDYALDGVEDTDLSDQAAFGSPFAALGQQVSTRRNDSDSTFVEGRWLSPQFGRLSLLGGVTYFEETANGDIDTDLVGASLAFTGGTLPAVLSINNDQSVESLSAFVEATFDLSDTLTLAGSVRYTQDDKTVDFVFAPTPFLAGFAIFPQAQQTSDSFENVSPGVSLTWSPNGDLQVYGKIQTGFRAGGFNFNVGSVANLPYAEETSVNYEVGARRGFLDGRGYVGASAFVLTQDDVLVSLFDFTQPAGLQGYLANVGEARTTGLELEGTLDVTDGLTLAASVGLLDAQFTDGAIGAVDLDGNTLPGSRELTWSLAANYRRALTPAIDLVVDGALAHRASGFQDPQNLFPIGAADIANLSAGLEFGHAEVRAFVQNALDDDYEIAFGGFRAPAESGVTLAPERTYGVSLRLRY